MTRFEMLVDMANAAFEDSAEMVTILHDVADCVEQGGDMGRIVDSNGNSVGLWSISTGEA